MRQRGKDQARVAAAHVNPLDHYTFGWHVGPRRDAQD
jgi:hypothetical protein